MAGSNTPAGWRSGSGTSPTTSPDHSSRPAASDPAYTLDCDEPHITTAQLLPQLLPTTVENARSPGQRGSDQGVQSALGGT